MATAPRSIRDEIRQTRPFQSPAHEALVSLLRTAAVVQRQIAQVVEVTGVTIQQYNVLRILRGAGGDGLPTLAIRDRMVEEAAGITRLLDKLEAAGFVVRERSVPDRRQVLCHITPEGTQLLARLDAPVNGATERAFAGLPVAEQHQLSELLASVRSGATSAE